MADDCIGLMDYLGIDRAHILGTSMGGMIAQQVALNAPERVINLVLASTTSWGEG
jgi:pimeloyl-ACP methyl ester carboxylesterase